MNVRDKVVVITGGASGIGFSSAEQLLQHNAKAIAVLDLPNSNGERAVAKLNELGKGRAMFFVCDVTNKAQAESCMKKVVETFGVPDILINSAGIANDNEFERMIDINLTGLARMTLLAIGIMGKQNGGKGGTIVNIASIAGLTPVDILPHYCATKYAVVGLTRSLAKSYGKTGVRMMLMCPGMTESQMTTNGFGAKCLECVLYGNKLQVLTESPKQSAELVGKGMVKLIERGANETVCVVTDSEPPVTIDLQHYEDLKKHSF